jgi:hypothetical protein
MDSQQDVTAAKKMRVAELRQHMEETGLDATGTKTEMLSLLASHLAHDSDAAADASNAVAAEDATLKVPNDDDRGRSRSPRKNATQSPSKKVPVESRSKSPPKTSSARNRSSRSPNQKSPIVAKASSKSPNRALSPKQKSPSRLPLVASGPNGVDSNVETNGDTNASGNKHKKKKKKKRAQIERRQLLPSSTPVPPPLQRHLMRQVNVDVEYVPVSMESMGMSESMPGFEEFSKIFQKFQPAVEEVVEPVEETKAQENDDDTDMDFESEVDEETERMNRKQAKKMRRMTVAQLKQLVAKPELVEVRLVIFTAFC